MSSQNTGLFTFFGTVLASVIVCSLGIWWADNRQGTILNERGREVLAEGLEAGTVPVYWHDPLPAANDPFSPDWDDAPVTWVAVEPQKVTMPLLEIASVDSVQVQALVDGAEIAWRIRWEDREPDLNIDTGRFCDAAAIQFPMTASAPHTMGGIGHRVFIMHWKGIWQKDVDEHFQDVQDIHPNYWADLYWFASGSFPYPVPDAFSNAASHQWFPAYASGNPVADFHRARPVEELTAEGFGTLTSHRDIVAKGGGAWKDGWWAVVFRRPLITGDPLDYQFVRGRGGRFSIAVWEGSAGNVGGRKHYSVWVPFEVQS